MSSLPTNKRSTGILLAAVVIILLAGSFYLFWYRPALSESKDLLADSEEKLKFLQATEAIVKSKREEVGSIKADNSVLDTIPALPEQEAMLQDLEAAAQASKITINEVTFSLDTSSESASSGTAESGASNKPGEFDLLSPTVDFSRLLDKSTLASFGLSTVNMTVRITGNLAQVKEFAANLQQDGRLYMVGSFSFGEESAGTETKNSTLDLAALYRVAGK